MPARVAALLLAFVVGMGATTAVSSTAAARADRDCSDFNTQAAAQEFFINAGGPQNDPHRLDEDGDGVACESNPCPCSTSQGGGGGDGPSTPPVKRQKAKIIRVIDGDTVAVKLLPGP